MSDHHSRSYYKDSYGSSSSKRYHSPSDSSRAGLPHYYDTSDARSKRIRADSYGNGTGTHTSATSRYNEYSSAGSSNSRYKAASPYYESSGLKASSSDYSRREDSYGRSGTASSSTKYLDDTYGKLQGSSRSATKSVVRRIPPPLTPPISSSSSKSMMKSSIAASSSTSSNRLLPLMKVTVASNSGGGGGGNGSSGGSKDYYGSRIRQAPPEHHYPHNSASSSYRKDFRRPSGFPSARYGTTNFSRPSSGYAGSSGSSTHGRNLAAIRKMTQRTAASVTSRIQRRASTAGVSRGFDDDRRRHPVARRKYSSKVGSEGSKDKESEKAKLKDVEESPGEKETNDADEDTIADGEDGNEIIEEIGGDDEINEKIVEEEKIQEDPKSEVTDKIDEDGKTDDKEEELETETDKTSENNESEDSKKPPAAKEEKESKKVDKHKSSSSKDQEKSERRRSQRDSSPSNRTLLKLHCHYCDIRCISFREFSNHLRSYVHTRAMHSAVTEMRKKLSNLRTDQRDDQRKLEKSKSDKTLSDTTSYCRVCELNFRTDPKEHEANELHNKIKTLIYQKCDICNIDFRIWKVYLYHLAALEHAKRVAMKELQEGEAKGENVKGTNLSQEELGLELVEQRTVFYCNACTRYLPIKGTLDETKSKHCLTLTHLKYVDEYRQREKHIALRKEREEAAAKDPPEDKNAEGEINTAEIKADDSSETVKNEEGNEDNNAANDEINLGDEKKDGSVEKEEKEDTEIEDDAAEKVKNIKREVDDTVVEEDDLESQDDYLSKVMTNHENEDKADGGEAPIKEPVVESQLEEKGVADRETNESMDEDEDEIELHAGDEVEEDLSMDDSGWSRRTRSSIRKNSTDRKTSN